jgi:hypothetical protein
MAAAANAIIARIGTSLSRIDLCSGSLAQLHGSLARYELLPRIVVLQHPL